METTQILENNKLIAEFIGATQLEKGIVNFKGIFLKEGKSFFNDYDLKFHNDWNWLMQVVKKCEKLNSKRIREEIGYRNIFGANIEIVYSACVEFIKWYNENKQD